MKAVFIERTGGPEVLTFGERPIPEPAAGEVLVKVAVSGVNFTDLNLRSGINKTPLPAIVGSEGAGTVERAPDGTGFHSGDRVAWVAAPGSAAGTCLAWAVQEPGMGLARAGCAKCTSRALCLVRP